MNKHYVLPTSQLDLHPLVSEDLAPLFWTPERMGLGSAWWAHVPFAFWITAVCKPRLFVELGTHNGVSYSAFCEAVLNARLGTRCYAVDTWAGDEHAGYYGDEIYNNLRSFHDARYSAFSELIRSTFDDALQYFDDESIDLLHIDGLHTYEAVRHDFESWRPKLSERAVALLHDTNVCREDFGVHRFFREISTQLPSFEFMHGFGLGVISVGAEVPAIIQQLCSLTDDREIGALRERFSHLGTRWLVSARESLAGAGLQAAGSRARKAEAANPVAFSEEAEAALERSRRAASERIRKRATQRVTHLRKTVEALGQVAEESRDMVAALSQRYSAVVDGMSGPQKKRKVPIPLLKRGEELFNPKLRRRRRQKRKKLSQMLEAADTIRRSIYFDDQWYRTTYRDVKDSGVDPALHYVKRGCAEGRDPGPWFSTRQYLNNNPDVAASGVNALYHYLKYGEREGRRFLRMETATPRRANRRNATFSLLYISGEPDTPGNQYRVLRYIDAALANGADAAWMPLSDLPSRMDEVRNYDALILWRVPWNGHVGAAINLMRSRGGKIVFDVDDLMIDPNLAQTKIIDGIRTQFLAEKNVRDHYELLRQTMLAADLCFTTTEELAFHMRWAGRVTHVLPNGFDQATHVLSRHAIREWRRQKDGFIRLGYAAGSRTHQRDLKLVAEALAKLLRENDTCRLVLFRTRDGTLPLVDVEELPALAGLEDRIEWRSLQPLANLPTELARFDINLAPLEFGNPFCEAKSELKFFEAALVEVPTVASPTGPFRRAIEHGKTGFLAATADDWYFYLKQLIEDPQLRQRIAHNAYNAALAAFGPAQRAAQFGRAIDQLRGGAAAARAFALDTHLATQKRTHPMVFPSELIFERDKGGAAEVTVTIPLYNYEQYIVEALESVRAQTLDLVDLVIVDGFSTDNSLAVAKAWAEKNAERFNRILVIRNRSNYGLGFCRNSGFDAAGTPYVLPLDADNKLLPSCCEVLLKTARRTNAAFVYPSIQHFGKSSAIIGNCPYDPKRFVFGNYVDAMALISKEAWAMIGGYDHVRYGWEDYDFWCRLAERGLPGEWQPEVLAEYRVHESSMMTGQTTVPENFRQLHENFKERHPWVSLVDQEMSRRLPTPRPRLTSPAEFSRLERLLPILRCPQTRHKFSLNSDRTALLTFDGLRSWPIIEGRPVLSPELQIPEIKSADHISNDLPDVALDLIKNCTGLVLNLSAGGSRSKFDHVVEVEYAIFRHTDVVGDAHALPFDDEVFEAIVVMNAFEHYREPRKVAEELMRVLKPEGRILIRTAFMQPLHERPWHFFNCTRYGLAEWFKSFETDKLHVSDNFTPSHSIAWLASEAEAALRGEVSSESADAFRAAPIGALIDLWRDPSKRQTPLWNDFAKLSQTTQEITAAGFEFQGRKPPALPDLNR